MSNSPSACASTYGQTYESHKNSADKTANVMSAARGNKHGGWGFPRRLRDFATPSGIIRLSCQLLLRYHMVGRALAEIASKLPFGQFTWQRAKKASILDSHKSHQSLDLT